MTRDLTLFDFTKLQYPSVISVFGKRLSGADVLMRKIFAGYDDSTNILAFTSPEIHMFDEDVFRGCIPDTVRYGEYDQRLVKQFIETQESSNSNGVLAWV
jgi:hypothetical protein